jgi:hypothetical protein
MRHTKNHIPPRPGSRLVTSVGLVGTLVRQHHKMREVPCLTPGETVTLLSLEQYKQR